MRHGRELVVYAVIGFSFASRGRGGLETGCVRKPSSTLCEAFSDQSIKSELIL
jgi:hypothetical protein